jgi:rhodanese-related sulfurtransferase
MTSERGLRVTTAEAAQLLQARSHAYLDVRSEQEFELGHVPNAVNIPWRIGLAGGPNPDFLRHVSARFPRHQPLVVGCQSGQRSRLACELLWQQGFETVLEHAAGIAGLRDAFGQLIETGWERAGLPLSYAAAPGSSYREICSAADG